MRSFYRYLVSERNVRAVLSSLLIVTAAFLAGCVTDSPSPESLSEANRSVTLLFTNDFESAYDPTRAYWRDDMENIGGIAELASLIREYRVREENVFLFDAGDIFTGSLAHLTQGEIAFELMNVMGYDAMSIGNHEFEFGWKVLAEQKKRAAFPVLGANLLYRKNGQPYAESVALIERGGIRIGVIGVLGQDAATALIPGNIAGVVVTDPVAAVEKHVRQLRSLSPAVDLVVVLTHQGPTAPMQTNDEAVPEVYRGNAENLALAAAVPGIDVIFAGHTDAGTPEALRDPVNGTLVMQTWGQGQHLGVLDVELGPDGRKVTARHSALVPVDSDRLEPDPAVSAVLESYRSRYPELYEVIGHIDAPATRAYYEESTLGNLLADFLLEHTNAEVGFMPSGALRKDLPGGALERGTLQDMFPFKDRIARLEVSGETLTAIIEQGLSLERGLLQVSGLSICYDPAAAPGQRVTSLAIGGQPLRNHQVYTIGTVEILAKGGDSYEQFLDAQSVRLSEELFSDALLGYFERANDRQQVIPVPSTGRYCVSNPPQA